MQKAVKRKGIKDAKIYPRISHQFLLFVDIFPQQLCYLTDYDRKQRPTLISPGRFNILA